MPLNTAEQSTSHSGDGDPLLIAMMCLVLAISMMLVVWPQLLWGLNRRLHNLSKRRPPLPPNPVSYTPFRIIGAVQLVVVATSLVASLRS